MASEWVFPQSPHTSGARYGGATSPSGETGHTHPRSRRHHGFQDGGGAGRLPWGECRPPSQLGETVHTRLISR